MTSLLLLRTLPLLRNGFLSHRHQVTIAAAGLLSHRRRLWCSLADKPQFRADDSPAEGSAAAMKSTPLVDDGWRFEDPDYRKWKNLEAEILRDIEPIALLAKDILHSDRYLDGERLEFEDEKIVTGKLLAYHPYSKDKIGCGLDFIMVDRHPQFRNSRCLFVVRTDGGWIDFSYQKCLRAYVRDKYPSHAERFLVLSMEEDETVYFDAMDEALAASITLVEVAFDTLRSHLRDDSEFAVIGRTPGIRPLNDYLQN